MTDTDRLAALLHDLEATQHFVRHEPADGYVTDGPTEIIECSTGVEGHLEDAADLIAAGVTLLDEERLARAIDKAERNGGNYGDMKRHRWLASGILAALGDSDD